MSGDSARPRASSAGRREADDLLAAPIDVSTLLAGAGKPEALEAPLRERLSRLRTRYPQIPAPGKRLDALVRQLTTAVAEAMRAPEASSSKLTAQLRTVRARGLGQANTLWPKLFVVAPRVGQAPLNPARASRTELSERLREVLGSRCQARADRLEWIVASVLAWQPAGPSELLEQVTQIDPKLAEDEALAPLLAANFEFEQPSGDDPGRAATPDWSALWRLNAQSAYGGDYPRSVKACLHEFLVNVRERDAGAEILDIGTGNHTATFVARRVSAGFRIYGIDVAHISPPPADARIEVARMAAERLGLRDQQFDAVTSINGIEYADMQRAFPEMLRVMRNDASALAVLHRPDSRIVAHSRRFMELLRSTPILEMLALAWSYLEYGNDTARDELGMLLAQLDKKMVDASSVQFYGVLLDGVRRAIRLRRSNPDEAHRLIRRFETDLRWAYEKGRFLTARTAAIPANREQLAAWLTGYGFQIETIETLADDDPAAQLPVGWAVRLRKPGSGF